MLTEARRKLPRLTLALGDFRAQLPAEVNGRFDCIVSAYTFHEFDLDTKTTVLGRLMGDNLRPAGRIIAGDIAFPSVADRAAVRTQWNARWDDDEHYWAADETYAACAGAGIAVRFVPVSFCAGVFMFSPMAKMRYALSPGIPLTAGESARGCPPTDSPAPR
jgi:hypothetical protein